MPSTTHRLLPDLGSIGHYGAAVFNAVFSLLVTCTLLGIVFITRPQEVMHDIPPSWWIPLALIIIPAQIMAQTVTWYTVWHREVPTPLAISRRFPRLPSMVRPLFSLAWAANFLIGFAIVVSLHKPGPSQEPDWWLLPLVLFIAFSLTSLANVYLMLFARSASSSEGFASAIWRYRYIIDILISVVAVLYYRAYQ